MWQDVEGAAPIIAITNGVHVATWQDARIRQPRDGDPDQLWDDAPGRSRRELLADVAERTGTQLEPDGLIIGFARRAATYKRADLIFSDPTRIEPLLQRRPPPARLRRQGAPARLRQARSWSRNLVDA